MSSSSQKEENTTITMSASNKAPPTVLFSPTPSVSFMLRDEASTPSSVSSRRRNNETISTKKRESGRSFTSHASSAVHNSGGGGNNGGGGTGSMQHRVSSFGTAEKKRGTTSSISNTNLNAVLGGPLTPNNNNNNRQSLPMETLLDEKSLMLLPPSQTIRESLNALAISTSNQLEAVWDELGCSPDERADQLTDLLSGFRQLCQEKITSEKMVLKNYYQTIANYKEELQTTSRALQIDDPDESLLQDNDGQRTLQDEVMILESALENLRSIAEVAQNDLTTCRDRLLEAHEALGIELDDTWNDVTSDLTEARRNEFHKKVKDIEEVVATRTSAIMQLIKDCQELNELLKSDPNDHELDRKIMNSLVKSEEDGKTLVMRSNVESEDCTGISSKSLDKLTNRISELNGEKRRRRAKLTQMGADIGELWEKLHVSVEEQENFANSISGLGLDTLEKGEEELKRLLQLKSEMMGKLILEAREEIQKLWDETNANEEQKQSFTGMSVVDDADFTDDLLAEHEDYIKALTNKLELMRPILSMIEKRELIVKERMEYEELQKDPERLQQRGSALTKQLMKEEKMSRRIKKDLPKYTASLEKKIKEWTVTNDEPFLYKGKVYLDVMKDQEDQWQEYKSKQMHLKLQKKQEEKITKASNKGTYKPLPGKKKKLASAPLSDGTNRIRAVSRGRNAYSSGDQKGRKNIRSKSRPASRP